MTFLNDFGKSIIPQKIRIHLKNYILKTGLNTVPYSTYAISFLFTIIFTTTFYFFTIFNTLKTSHTVGLLFGSFISLTITETIV